MQTALTEFIGLMVGGASTLATGIAGAVVDMAKALFLNVSDQGVVTGLSIFGGIIGIFAGIGLAVGITTRVYLWVTSLGH